MLKMGCLWQALRRTLCGFMAVILTATSLPVHAADFVAAMGNGLSVPGAMVHFSDAYQPPVLAGIKVSAQEPFKFDFILDKGDFEKIGDGRQTADGLRLTSDDLKAESTRLIKYFLAALTVPEDDLWVNLSPYEKDRIITHEFGETQMGRELLAQDYLLKQITASAIYPEDDLGKKFWAEVYKTAQEKYGTTDIPVDTFNKVWIVPEKAVVYEKVQDVEHQAQDGTAVAYVVESRLKVMLESDYLAQEKDAGRLTAETGECLDESGVVDPSLGVKCQADKVSLPQDLGKQVLREVVVPILEREVNEGRNFAPLRQIYHSLILADWFKRKIKNSVLSQVYVDRKMIVGLKRSEGSLSDLSPEDIWKRYVEAFKKGAFNMIKEEQDSVSGEMIPRKYFSGGCRMKLDRARATTSEPAMLPQGRTLFFVQSSAEPTTVSHELSGVTETASLPASGKTEKAERFYVRQENPSPWVPAMKDVEEGKLAWFVQGGHALGDTYSASLNSTGVAFIVYDKDGVGIRFGHFPSSRGPKDMLSQVKADHRIVIVPGSENGDVNDLVEYLKQGGMKDENIYVHAPTKTFPSQGISFVLLKANGEVVINYFDHELRSLGVEVVRNEKYSLHADDSEDGGEFDQWAGTPDTAEPDIKEMIEAVRSALPSFSPRDIGLFSPGDPWKEEFLAIMKAFGRGMVSTKGPEIRFHVVDIAAKWIHRFKKGIEDMKYLQGRFPIDIDFYRADALNAAKFLPERSLDFIYMRFGPDISPELVRVMVDRLRSGGVLYLQGVFPDHDPQGIAEILRKDGVLLSDILTLKSGKVFFQKKENMAVIKGVGADRELAMKIDDASAENQLFDHEQFAKKIAMGELDDTEVLVFDYDGTLADDKSPLSSDMVETLLAALDAKKKIVILTNGNFERLREHFENSKDAKGMPIRSRLIDGKKIVLYVAGGGAAYDVDSTGYLKTDLVPFTGDATVERLSSVLLSIAQKFPEENMEPQVLTSDGVISLRFRLLHGQRIPEILEYLKQETKKRGIILPDTSGPFIDTKPFDGDKNGELYHYNAWFLAINKGETMEKKIFPRFGTKVIYFGDGFEPGGSDEEVKGIPGLVKASVSNYKETASAVHMLLARNSAAQAGSNPAMKELMFDPGTSDQEILDEFAVDAGRHLNIQSNAGRLVPWVNGMIQGLKTATSFNEFVTRKAEELSGFDVHLSVGEAKVFVVNMIERANNLGLLSPKEMLWFQPDHKKTQNPTFAIAAPNLTGFGDLARINIIVQGLHRELKAMGIESFTIKIFVMPHDKDKILSLNKDMERQWNVKFILMEGEKISGDSSELQGVDALFTMVRPVQDVVRLDGNSFEGTTLPPVCLTVSESDSDGRVLSNTRNTLRKVFEIKTGFARESSGFFINPFVTDLYQRSLSWSPVQRIQEKESVLAEALPSAGQEAIKQAARTPWGFIYMHYEGWRYLGGLKDRKGPITIFTFLDQANRLDRNFDEFKEMKDGAESNKWPIEFYDLRAQPELVAGIDFQKPGIRVINLGAQSQELNIRFLAASDLPVGVTGDESLLQSLLLRRQFVYEVLGWKTRQFANMLDDMRGREGAKGAKFADAVDMLKDASFSGMPVARRFLEDDPIREQQFRDYGDIVAARDLLPAMTDNVVREVAFARFLQEEKKKNSFQGFPMGQAVKAAEGESEPAMKVGDKTGGIDLRAKRMDVKTTGSGDAIQFNIDSAKFERFRKASGFVPVIFSIQPLEDLFQFLGVRSVEPLHTAG